MQQHKTARELVETELLRRFKKIKIFEPLQDHTIVDKFKNDTYGMSNLGFALYSNGHNLRGKSALAPFGLIYHDNECLFSIGYFKRHGEQLDTPGYLMIIAPRGNSVTEVVHSFAQRVVSEKIPVSGIYIRHLKLKQFVELLNLGYAPIEMHPWHPEAPKEDESLGNSTISLERIIIDKNIQSLDSIETKNHRKNFRLHVNRFSNFLKRTGLEYTLRPLETGEENTALDIITSHFKALRKKGKAICSTTEDYMNVISTELLSLNCVNARIGFLGKVPVSLFVYETLGPGTIGAYATFTIREEELILPKLGLKENTGFSAMPMYAYAELFSQLIKQGVKTVNLGGSEHPDLNLIKRHMGGESDPSWWVVLKN